MYLLTLVSCNNDKDEPSLPELTISSISVTSGDLTRTGVVDNNALTVGFQPFPPRTDLTAITVNVTLPEGVSVTPESGSAQDFSSGAVAYTISNGEESLEYQVNQ